MNKRKKEEEEKVKQQIFERRKKTIRSPDVQKITEEIEEKTSRTEGGRKEMEELKELMKEMMKQMEENMQGIRQEIKEMKKEIGEREKKWKKEKEKLVERIEKLEKKAEDADVTKESDILNAFDWITNNIGPVHILINNAGVYKTANLLDGKTESWKLILDTNLMGLCIATREAAKIMRENSIDGHIIHVNSVTGHYVPRTIKSNTYGASKFAVTSLTEALRLELNEIQSKIKITSISPGIVKTELFDKTELDTLFSTIPYLEPKDVADAVCYALGTPARVQIRDIILTAVGEML